jgi:thiamine-phosphate pyrophosphorylase
VTPRVIQISDAGALPQAELLARLARAGEGFAVQLRDPELSPRQLLALGAELRARSRWLVVNDRLDVARHLGADGVHLGRRSVAVADARRFCGPVWVSRSAHSLEEARAAADEGADAVLLSPIFPSPGKGAALGLAALGEARRLLPPGVALYALGGVTLELAPACLAAGASGVAAIRADLTRLR